MAKQVSGAAIGLAMALGYLLLVEAMAAAIVVLAHFTVLQWRALRSLLTVEPPRAVPVPVGDQDQAHGEAPRQAYRLGGDLKWH